MFFSIRELLLNQDCYKIQLPWYKTRLLHRARCTQPRPRQNTKHLVVTNPKTRSPPCAREKNTLATCSNRWHIAITDSRKIGFCSTTQVRSQWVAEWRTCKTLVVVFRSKTMSFLWREIAQQKAGAPKSTSCFKSLLSPRSQELNIFEILQGGYRFVATWIRFQVVRARGHLKKRCLTVSSLWQKQHFTLP
jgi:hypothetical protein